MVWRPPPPRQLPTQDHPALDAAERAAHRFTWAVAAAAGAVALLVLCALAARLVG